MKRLAIVLLVFALLGPAAAAFAQTKLVNPREGTFTASVDHAQTDTYVIGFFRPGAAEPVQTQNLGKPVPDAANLCTFTFTSQPLSMGPDYVARVKAVSGAAGGAWSEPSNPFDVEPTQPQATTMTTAQKVKLAVVPTGGTIPVGTLLVWSSEGDGAANRMGTFQDIAGEFAVWYFPEKSGNHVVRLSLVVEGQTFNASLPITVTWALPASVAISVGVPVAR